MGFFNYQNGKLFIEDVMAEDITQAVGTPAYVYSQSTFLNNLAKIKRAYSW